jgi:hypothetical protein
VTRSTPRPSLIFAFSFRGIVRGVSPDKFHVFAAPVHRCRASSRSSRRRGRRRESGHLRPDDRRDAITWFFGVSTRRSIWDAVAGRIVRPSSSCPSTRGSVGDTRNVNLVGGFGGGVDVDVTPCGESLDDDESPGAVSSHRGDLLLLLESGRSSDGSLL